MDNPVEEKRPMPSLRDSFNRVFHYLRLSVTDACNFSCVYCLPNGFRKIPDSDPPLSVDEIRNLVIGFAELGFWKVRLTGGEPTLRRDILEIARTVSTIPGIRSVALSTNGYRLNQLAVPLREAGITALNISVDSLDSDRFRMATGCDRLEEILQGVRCALQAGYSRIKINAVLLKGVNEEDFLLFQDWIRTAPITVRFIELMRTGQNESLFKQRHLSTGELQLRLLRAGWRPLPRQDGDGPAVEFSHPEFQGRFGLIAPYSRDFCASCNRLRVSSLGSLRLCLFGERDYSLRPFLQSPRLKGDLIHAIESLIGRKPVSHLLHEDKYGQTSTFSAIGG